MREMAMETTTWHGGVCWRAFVCVCAPCALLLVKLRRWRWGLTLRVPLTRLCVDKQVHN